MTIYRKTSSGHYEVQPIGAAPAAPAPVRAEIPAPVSSPRDTSSPVYLTRSPVPPRSAGDRDPLALIPVFRAVQLMTTAAGQLPLTVERQGKTLSGDEMPALVRRPSLEMDRPDFIGQCVTSLMLTGELFVQRIRQGGEVLELRVIPPAEVTVTRNESTRVRTYHYAGKRWTDQDFDHQTMIRPVGQLRGIGPLQAARVELDGAADVRDYAGNWFNGSGHPTGILASDQPLSAEDAQLYRDQWNRYDRDEQKFLDADGSNPSGIRVLGKGLSYTPIFLNPKDAQWLEARQFTITDVARLFGVPASLMLVALEGNSLTYSNVEQEWLAFVRFTLMAYVQKIEETLTKLTPLGQRVKFNLEGLLRSDTKTRYESYEIAVRTGWMTPDEARAHEGLPPLTAAQRSTLTTAPQEAPAS